MQYLVLAELCNECGDCVTFCPERGAPWQIKPRLYTDAAAWEARGKDGMLVGAPGETPAADDAGPARSLVGALVRDLGWLRKQRDR